MFYIQDSSYSLADVKSKSLNFIANTKLDDWETVFWSFLKDWFSEEFETISVKTSGSTGKPKTILHKKEYMKASARMTCNFFELNNQKTALLCLPANTIGGIMMIVRALESGMNLIVQKPNSNPLANLDRKIDFAAMVPFQVQQTFEMNKTAFQKLDTIIIGGGTISTNLENEIKKAGLKAYSTFGMTETISHIALNKIGENKVYNALDNVEFSLSKENTLIINAPKIGINDLETNDLVDLLSKTEMLWLGRKDNAIETGGFKILPETVEEKLFPFVQKPFIISSIPDVLLNNKLVLIIESEAFDFDTKIFDKLLSKYEIPKQIFFVKDFIYTQNGKIDRRNTQKLVFNIE